MRKIVEGERLLLNMGECWMAGKVLKYDGYVIEMEEVRITDDFMRLGDLLRGDCLPPSSRRIDYTGIRMGSVKSVTFLDPEPAKATVAGPAKPY
jgi:hypothetical protein